MAPTVSECPLPPNARQLENKGWVWVFGAFVFCPCHLPFTLGLLATVLSGTIVGALLHNHPYLSGAAITVVWVAATWRGIAYLRSAGVRLRSFKP